MGFLVILINLSLLHVCSLPSVGSEQKLRTAEVIVSNLLIKEERILVEIENY